MVRAETILAVVGLLFLVIQCFNWRYHVSKAEIRKKRKELSQRKRGNIRLKGKSYYEDMGYEE